MVEPEKGSGRELQEGEERKGAGALEMELEKDVWREDEIGAI